MSKCKFRQQRVISGREARRYNAREQGKEERQKAIDAWWALPADVRKERMEANEAFRRINKNGITLDDVKAAEEKAYREGIEHGVDSTIRMCYAAACLALHDLHGFGRKRAARVLNLMDEKVCMALTSQEVIQEVFDKLKIQLEFKDALPGERVQEVG